ncbi:MAG: TlpA family protein disulfide reductase [Acidobacteriota bacterium]|nr:TlpA family protein disulfide reductase [Acidobacteriota bacterium]
MKNMIRFLLALSLTCTWAMNHVAAQQQSGASARPAAALYQEITNYSKQRRQDLSSQGKAFDAEASEKIEKEQRKLAANYAAQLATRADLKGMDVFYLGSLHNFADQRAEALAAMRRFLAEGGADAKGTPAQVARNIISIYAAQNKSLDEAEAALAAYLADEPQSPLHVFQMEMELALAQRKAKQPERALAHSRAAFEAAKKPGPESLPVRLIVEAGTTLADIYQDMKKKEEAQAVVIDLYNLALDLPSANLYRQVAGRFAGKERAAGEARAALATAGQAKTAPELEVVEWIDQPPTKLAELRGNVVLIDFWYEWCGPCRMAFPTLRGWHKKYKDKGLTVIGLTDYQGTLGRSGMSEPQKLEFLRKLKQDEKIPYAFAIAETGTGNQRAYGVSAYPTAMLIDRRGVVRFISIGVSPQELDELGGMIDKLVKEEPPAAK